MRIGKCITYLFTLVACLGLLCPEALAANAGKVTCFVGYSIKSRADVDQRDAEAALRVLAEELADQYGFHVEATLYESVDKLVNDFAAKKLDFASINSVEYLQAAKTLKAKPEMTQYRNGTVFVKYLVLANADIQQKGLTHLKNKKLSIQKDNKLSRLFLDTLLMQANLPPCGRFFAVTQEKTKDSQAILDVFFGRTDVCVVADASYRTMTEMNPQVGLKLRVIGESPGLISTVAFFRPDWPLEYKTKAIKAMSSEYKNHERGKQIMLLFNIERMDVIDEGDLDSLRKLVADYNRLSKKK